MKVHTVPSISCEGMTVGYLRRLDINVDIKVRHQRQTSMLGTSSDNNGDRRLHQRSSTTLGNLLDISQGQAELG